MKSTQPFHILTGATLAFSVISLAAHNGQWPSIHDTVAGIQERLQTDDNVGTIQRITRDQIESILTSEEKEILGNAHVRFQVNVPVVVSVVHTWESGEEPVWLSDRGFERSETELTVDGSIEQVALWQKRFDAGWIGLGINSLERSDYHYAVGLTPVSDREPLRVTRLYPGQLRVAEWNQGVSLYADQPLDIDEAPEQLQGQVLVQTLHDNRNDAELAGTFRPTEYPSSTRPDQIVLTWSADPKTTQTIQWRAAAEVEQGRVQYQKKALHHRFRPVQLKQAEAERMELTSREVLNDPQVSRFTATLRNLEPGTTYVYSVGNGDAENWSELREFTTAPDRTEPFSFIYMGDAQNGLKRWGTLVHHAYRERPDAAFYVMAGDLVNRGNDRDNWDSFFGNAKGIFDRRQLVPAIGNHENQGGHPTLYLKTFHLRNNGPKTIEEERAYSFEYGNAQFVILDSNLDPEPQTEWLDKTLGRSDAVWKFVVYHHPAYSSAPGRDNRDIRKWWLPIFDKHHVDMALQGHDHAYLRTHPMRNDQPVDSPKKGTVYVVSVSGTKMYGQADRDYTAFGMTEVSTYQTLDIQLSDDRLLYRAYDIDGQLRDELEINK